MISDTKPDEKPDEKKDMQMDTPPGENSIPGTCLEWIKKQTVMTLATFSPAGAWSAPVYYIFRASKFFFFSGTKSRHIEDALIPGVVSAASIFEDKSRFNQIKGIQMSGKIEAAGKKMDALKVAALYAKRFKLPADAAQSLRYFETTYHARLFCFIPEHLFFMDNAKGFGHRQEILI